ncbi:DUF523 domain-containing protein [Chengkuizengella axinellae]|uniref:DUF523 domain-containing protein n=1 Tax=Chengkuizengella axinellae TaxID=3064388 RepID=A0ABT9IYD0_9BACL|nr:DUF523 domain-containing protein [Chengkuizengella sp. 2205SS18-9]MDP5274308.1 DUF523 domain-containing protein [Chengkuizengella sp. 2205SS18-9]
MILVSACLAGDECRYNATHKLDSSIQTLAEEGKAALACPELLGGFSTPRQPAEIVGGNGLDVINGTAKVIDKSGKDVTDLYINGAEKTLEMAQSIKAEYVILKENSPSCGSCYIYNGEFNGTKVIGLGVTTALLKKHGFKVISEEDYKAQKLNF